MTESQIDAAAIESRIRTYRMGDLTVTVKDRDGRPVAGVDIAVEQTRHAFLFGGNFFGYRPESEAPEQVAYRDQFADLLNFATLPFYWGGFEPNRGEPQYKRLDAMARWSVDHGLTVKGHPLIWHEVLPRWAPQKPEEVVPLLRQRVYDIIGHFKDTIHIWDVINESVVAPGYVNPSAVTRWHERDGRENVVETALDWARDAARANPSELLYNDYDLGPEYEALLGELARRGKLPDAVGLQSHMHGQTWTLGQAWEICERFARFGRPLHFTELTVLSGKNYRVEDVKDNPPSPWESTPEGEAAQADYLEQLYTLLFSHPAVQAITYWDISDAFAWMGAPAGLLRADSSPKPAYDRLKALIKGAWWTKATATTDAAGQATVRAFHGDHTVTVAGGEPNPVTIIGAGTEIQIAS